MSSRGRWATSGNRVCTGSPSQCTRTCCTAARPIPWLPPSLRNSGSCQSLNPTGIPATSGCRPTSAIRALASHRLLDFPLGGPAPSCSALQLRLRRASGGFNWPAWGARGIQVGPLVTRREQARSSFLPGIPPGSRKARRGPLDHRPQAADGCSLRFAPIRMEEFSGKSLSCAEKEKVPGLREG